MTEIIALCRAQNSNKLRNLQIFMVTMMISHYHEKEIINSFYFNGFRIVNVLIEPFDSIQIPL